MRTLKHERTNCYHSHLLFQLENLVYFNRLKHSKIVISDFHLAKLENGLIKDPCGTPEYLGERAFRRFSEALQPAGAGITRLSRSCAAPEVVGRQRYGRPVDCWATGVIMYIL